jgi:hypothetical protein
VDEPPRFTLLSDEPYHDTAEADPLGFDVVARDLADLLIRSAGATPLTLGIEGDWGTGKSSLMRRIDACLAGRKVQTVWFNAWAAGSGSGPEGLVKTVLNRVDRNVLRNTLRRRHVMTGLRLALTVVAAWLKIGALVDAIWQEVGLDPKTRSELGELVVDIMEDWLKHRPSIPTGILAVFIDDLDRCPPSAVLEIFEAMRLYLGAPGFVFVLGYDRNIVSASILKSQRYDASVTVRAYLEKIVQISYRIERPGDEQAERLIQRYLHLSGTADLFQVADRQEILRRNARNPRRVKRFVNNVVLEYPLDRDWQRLGPARLVTVLVLQYYWPEFLRLLNEQPESDVVSCFVQYVEARRIIRAGTPRDSPDWRLVVEAFRSNGLALPAADEQARELVAALDEEVGPEFVRLAQQDALVAIVRTLSTAEWMPLLEKLRRRPVSMRAGGEETPTAEPALVSAPDPVEPTDDRGSAVAQRRNASVARVDFPPASGPPPYRLDLTAVLPPDDVRQIEEQGRIVFHAAGSVGGIRNPTPQAAVARAMTNELATLRPAPSFLYLLGDVVYFYGQTSNYHLQFYVPYSQYQRPIFAIAGNHDAGAGGNSDPGAEPPLRGFARNFCAPPGTRTAEAGDVNRTAMVQPNVYWTLRAPFVTIIGLFTGVPEGGRVDEEQASWLASELRDAPDDRAVIVAMHHPVYSFDTHHSGSTIMRNVLDGAVSEASRAPDLVLAGHVTNYQRFSRQLSDRVVPYVVAGAGGYPTIRRMSTIDKRPPPVPLALQGNEVTLAAYHDRSHGFLRVEASAGRLEGTYMAVRSREGSPPEEVDRFAIDLGR